MQNVSILPPQARKPISSAYRQFTSQMQKAAVEYCTTNNLNCSEQHALQTAISVALRTSPAASMFRQISASLSAVEVMMHYILPQKLNWRHGSPEEFCSRHEKPAATNTPGHQYIAHEPYNLDGGYHLTSRLGGSLSFEKIIPTIDPLDRSSNMLYLYKSEEGKTASEILKSSHVAVSAIPV
ncbi:hypothetical protein, conserved [Eimeria necatrix]|uniref:Uncharacterized protein n=1 Tax=Eimeria necatrix TaxID=51315 RepID=U6ML98_9EIME|nr:hypothetical protein, conserved [Eimeria necatrix]CDJ62430.1 hypothetical protein, conserved [Eimeria necatrix]